MSRVVAPLDPDTPAGQAAAEALSQALGEIYAGIARRRATGGPRPTRQTPPPTPRPTTPPQPPPRPAGPSTPVRPAGPRRAA